MHKSGGGPKNSGHGLPRTPRVLDMCLQSENLAGVEACTIIQVWVFARESKMIGKNSLSMLSHRYAFCDGAGSHGGPLIDEIVFRWSVGDNSPVCSSMSRE